MTARQPDSKTAIQWIMNDCKRAGQQNGWTINIDGMQDSWTGRQLNNQHWRIARQLDRKTAGQSTLADYETAGQKDSGTIDINGQQYSNTVGQPRLTDCSQSAGQSRCMDRKAARQPYN